jgi:hypothetical protein
VNKSTLLTILDAHGLKIDGYREGVGSFRDLEIGVGAPFKALQALKAELLQAGGGIVNITNVTNSEHPDFPKMYLEVGSFWWVD